MHHKFLKSTELSPQGIWAWAKQLVETLNNDEASASLYIRITNADPPPVQPNGGCIFVENGALKYIGSSGTVTVLAPA